MVYQNSGEKWRAMSTIKALQALKKHPKEITTLEVHVSSSLLLTIDLSYMWSTV